MTYVAEGGVRIMAALNKTKRSYFNNFFASCVRLDSAWLDQCLNKSVLSFILIVLLGAISRSVCGVGRELVVSNSFFVLL